MICLGLYTLAAIGIIHGEPFIVLPSNQWNDPVQGSIVSDVHLLKKSATGIQNSDLFNSIYQANDILRSKKVQIPQYSVNREGKKKHFWQHFRAINGPSYPAVIEMNNDAELALLSQTIFNQNFPVTAGRPVPFSSQQLQEWRTHIAPYCTFSPPTFYCNPKDKFRTADGSCNNLQNPAWGSAMREQRRFLPPAYNDGFNAPRTRSVKGRPLPSARHISNVVHSCLKCNKFGRFTSALMAYGTFLVREVVQTPVSNDLQEGTDCCTMINAQNRNCFPIDIPFGDPRFGNKGCMPLTRSMAAPRPHCDPGVREQINQLTSYIDASNVYGSTSEEQYQERLGINGLLKTPDKGCLLSIAAGQCPSAGDTRNQLVPTSAAVYRTFLLEHNRLAMGFKALNRHWDDERIFQEARKITSAVLQHITYNEYLPVILGRKHMTIFGLTPRRYGHNTVYNPEVDATVGNAFSAAAFRYGHSTIPNFLQLLNSDFQQSTIVPIHKEINQLRLLFQKQGKSRLVRGMLNDLIAPQDGILSESVRNLLLLDREGNSLDLAAINIQRGRDHGTNAYNKWRKWCGLRPAVHFGVGPGGLEHHDHYTASLLAKVYKHPDDIDLFTGGLSERPVPGGLIGPTFACMVARQFKNLKEGDRFWYENNFPRTGFNLAQLNEIRKVTLASVLCRNANLSIVQPVAFSLPSARNRRRPCHTIPKINLKYWKEIILPSPIPYSPLSPVLLG